MNSTRLFSYIFATQLIIALWGCITVLSQTHEGIYPSERMPDKKNCEKLLQADLVGIEITSVELIPANQESGRPAHCDVLGVIEDRIRFQVFLPVKESWNGRFIMGGGGGFVGSLHNHAMGRFVGHGGDALQRGFGTIGSDTGHRGGTTDASWALDNDTAVLDWGHRSVPLTANAGKQLVAAFYGQPAKFSYFLGCSTGGRQGMMAAQRYPDLFDGIVAGAPAINFTGSKLAMLTIAQAIFPDGDPENPLLSDDGLEAIARVVLGRCDTIDGLEDGILSAPWDCDFDPRTHLDGFSDEQLRVIETIYAGITFEGQELHMGFPPGGEATPGGWNVWLTGTGNYPPKTDNNSPSLGYLFGLESFRYLVLKNPGLGLHDIKLDRKLVRQMTTLAQITNATNPDLHNFQNAGGKLLVYHGLADHIIPVDESLNYYERAAERLSADEILSDFFRLFLMPGVTHCADGDGPDQVDWLSAITEWVEKDNPPEKLIAFRFDHDGKQVLSRPLCPYPEEIIYDGDGDADRYESFSCQRPAD